jgi:hypothetical protein
MRKKATISTVQKQLDDLCEVAESAVNGYEKYLLDEINYMTLAKIMTNLRDHIPKGMTGDK